jgi:shikimate kinase
VTARCGSSRGILESGPQVLATGGGAYMNPETRARIRERGISVWLKAELDVLMKRVKRRGDRPLLKADDPQAVLKPADGRALSGLCRGGPHRRVAASASHEEVVDDVLAALAEHLRQTVEGGTP